MKAICLGTKRLENANSSSLKLAKDPASSSIESRIKTLQINPEDAMRILARLLESSDAGTRWMAVEELGMISSKDAISSLLKLLEDPVAYVRKSVAEALGKIGSKDAIPGLLKLLVGHLA